MTVTLRDIVLSVRYGEAALVGESAGYLILGAADAALEVPRAASLDSIVLSDDGSVSMDASSCAFAQSEQSLRQMLGQLLSLVRTPCPNLTRVAERRDALGLAGLVKELEAALVPVNRRASRRSLARLVRDAVKSAQRVRSQAAVEEVEYHEVLPEEVVEEPSVYREAPSVIEDSAAFSALEGAGPQSTAAGPGLKVPGPPVVSEARSVPDDVASLPNQNQSGASSELVQKLVEVQEALALRSRAKCQTGSEAGETAAVGSRPTEVQSAVQVTRPSRSPHTSIPLRSTSASRALADLYVEPDAFEERDELDEAPTRIYAAEVTPRDPAPPASVSVSPEPEVEVTPRDPAPPASVSVSPEPEALQESEAAQSPPVVQISPTAPVEKVVLARRPQSPLPPSIRRRRAPISEHVSLIPATHQGRARNPSDIQELLNRMPLPTQPDDELFSGLKHLSRVDLSPLAPPVGLSWAE